MKTRLYKKLVKFACRVANVTKSQLFSGSYRPFVLYTYRYNFAKRKMDGNDSLVIVGDNKAYGKPLLSAVWNDTDLSTEWLMKYWKHSHWKPYIRVQLDLGKGLELTKQETSHPLGYDMNCKKIIKMHFLAKLCTISSK